MPRSIELLGTRVSPLVGPGALPPASTSADGVHGAARTEKSPRSTSFHLTLLRLLAGLSVGTAVPAVRSGSRGSLRTGKPASELKGSASCVWPGFRLVSVHPRIGFVTAASLPESVQQLIGEYIDSAELLEILLYLHRNPGQSYTAEALSPAVYTVPAAALLRLEELVASGFAASDGAGNPAYRYAPSSAVLAARVNELAEAYAANRIAVIQTIFQKPKSAAQSMADAFRLRGGR